MARAELVADFMPIDPVAVDPDTTIKDVVRQLRAYGLSALPVVDARGRPVGVISLADPAMVPPRLSVLHRAKLAGLHVRELMSRSPITIPVRTSLAEAGRIMCEAHVAQLVAVDDHGRAMGVLSAGDVVALVAEG